MEHERSDTAWAHGDVAGPMTDVLAADDHGDGDGHFDDVSRDHGQAHPAGEGPPRADVSTPRRSIDDIERLLDGVEAALDRLDEGTYGVCTSCGSPITDERLTASPVATRCATCDPADREG